MTPEYRLTLLYDPSDPFWYMLLIAILSGVLFAVVFFLTLESLRRLRDAVGECHLVKWRGPHLGGGHR